MTFGCLDAPWDGSWLAVIFSVREEQRDKRHLLRRWLRWHGFAPLYDGVWISPRADTAETIDVIESVGVATSTLFVGRVAHTLNGGDPLSAWDLDGLRKSYEEFIKTFSPLLERARKGRVRPAEALVARTRLMNVWRHFPDLDPELPDEALPGGWPLGKARRIFAELYDTLGPLAETRVKQILSEHEPGLARHVHHITTTSLRKTTPT